MKTIWKFKLKTYLEQDIEMPTGAIILCLQTQHEIPCIWALVDPDAPKMSRRFITHGTGHPMTETTTCYLGSYQLQMGAFVFHVFEDLFNARKN